MKQIKIKRGTPAPLFDRIVEDRLGAAPQLLNAQELKDSIIHEVSIVLNTRCTVRKVIYEDHLEMIPLFGLPDFFGLSDFSYFDSANPEDWPTMARFIETAIQAAEPRLHHINVTVDHYDSVNQALSVMVSASGKETPLLKDIHFPLTLYQWRSSSRKAAA